MQCRILKWISPEDPPYMSGEPYKDKIKIKVLLGDDTDEKADAIVSIDSFEHFTDPASMLT